jgi:nicotinamidase/pyrazinamidase
MKKILIIVDVQNDFVDGSLAVKGSHEAIENINKLVKDTKFDEIIATQDWHHFDHKSFSQWPIHCVAGTFGAELHKDLPLGKISMTVHKGLNSFVESYSAIFDEEGGFASPLVRYLDQEVETSNAAIYICGIATEYCVAGTALDIQGRYGDDCKVLVCGNACAAVDEKVHHLELNNFAKAGIEVFDI